MEGWETGGASELKTTHMPARFLACSLSLIRAEPASRSKIGTKGFLLSYQVQTHLFRNLKLAVSKGNIITTENMETTPPYPTTHAIFQLAHLFLT